MPVNRWYVIQTQYRNEKAAALNLRRQGFEAYLPLYSKRRRHARRTDWVPSPLFPRYMFVSMDVNLECWRAVRSTIGVSSLVSYGDLPAPLPEGIVEEIRAREDECGLVNIHNQSQFQKGDPVQILQGPFSDLVGMFDCANDDERVIILLDLLGRETKVHLPLEAVCACA